MKKNRRIILLLMVIMSSIWFIIYNLKSFNIYDTNFPCVGLTTYTIGEFYSKYSEDIDKDYYSDKNDYRSISISSGRSGNINSIDGIDDIPYFQEAKTLYLNGTCITEVKFFQELENLQTLWLSDTKINSFEDLQGIENINELYLNGTDISKMEGLENMNNLWTLDLIDTQITTIENIENIRTDSSSELVIFFDTWKGGKHPESITEESYEYAINPENNISIIIFDDQNCDLAITGKNYGDSKENVEECLNII
ncbi:leucine-rich repeat domain-containing protein [Mollicutes bacterium LVI A0039]|nr:leucine-rich repeat domain-containing protein [Mollicutes bacterium LVI A0039]